jgi:streptogramin lyase
MFDLSPLWKLLRGSGKRRAAVRKPPRPRLALEALDERILLSVTEFPVPTPQSNPYGITRGPDGNLWFTEALAGKIGRITPAGAITEFSAGITPGGQPTRITAGPDGNLWFTEQFPDRIGRITPAGVITEFSAGIPSFSEPYGITAGPDGNLWFTMEQGGGGRLVGAIGRITPAGVVTVFSLGSITQPNLITAGPDGNLWFGEFGNDPQAPGKIGRITPAGAITEFGGLPDQVSGVTAGPDGNLWFTEPSHFTIGKITPAGVITEVARTSAGAVPSEIRTGPDGNLWFTEVGRDRIGRLTPAGVLTEFDATSQPWATWPVGIAVGPDGNIWYTELAGNQIGRLDLAQAAPQTTTTLRTSIATAVVGQTEVLTATVTAQAGVPTGTVLFKDGNTQLGFAQVDANGQATLAVSLGVGNHALTASFVSNTFPGSTSAAVGVTVNRASTAVALTSSVNPAATGQVVTFTATVAVVAPGAGTPTGTVTFKDGDVVLGAVAVGADGKARVTTSFAAVGGHAITAVYGGSGAFAASTSAVLAETVASTNRAPSLDPIADQTVPPDQQVLTVPLSATDPDGDALSFSVSAQSLAFVLNQQAGGLSYHPEFDNSGGAGEKWLLAADGVTWYFIEADGTLFQWDGSDAVSGTALGNVGSSYYADPTLIAAAPADDPRAALAVSGDTLTITRDPSFVSGMVVTVTVSDGHGHTDSRAFTITVA